MRCPHCAGEIHDQSRFCGICGRGLDPPAEPAPAHPGWAPEAASASLFELPPSRRGRATRLAVVLGLDAILVGVGIALILSYANARQEARRGRGGNTAAHPVTTGSSVEILAPTPVGPTAPETATPPAAGDLEPSARTSRARSRSGQSASSRTDPGPPEPDSSRIPSPDRGAAPAESNEGPRILSEENEAPRILSEEKEAPTESKDADMEMLTRKVAGVVNSHRSQFERCSRQVAKAAGPVQGNVVIRFAIQSDGRAADVRTSSNTTGSDRLAACLVAQFESWSFPEHGGSEPVAFLWPLVFKAPQ